MSNPAGHSPGGAIPGATAGFPQQQLIPNGHQSQQLLQGGGFFPIPTQYRPNTTPSIPYTSWALSPSSLGTYVPLDIPNGILSTTSNNINTALLLQQQQQQQAQQMTAERQFALLQQQQQQQQLMAAAMVASTGRSQTPDHSAAAAAAAYQYGLMMSSGTTPFSPSPRSAFLSPHTNISAGGMFSQQGAPASYFAIPPGLSSNPTVNPAAQFLNPVHALNVRGTPGSYPPQMVPMTQGPPSASATSIPSSSTAVTFNSNRNVSHQQNLVASSKQPGSSSISFSPPSPAKRNRPQPLSGLLPGEHECWISPLAIDDLINEAQTIINLKQPDPSPVLNASTLFQSSPLPPNFQHLIGSAVVTGRDVCQVCFESQRPARFCFFGDFLMECSDCQVVVHRRCYGVHRMFDNFPIGGSRRKFLCDFCRHLRVEKLKKHEDSTQQSESKSFSTSIDGRCIVCYRSDGPRKRTSVGDWVHVYCALLSPHVIRIRDLKNMSKFEIISKQLLKLPPQTEAIMKEENVENVKAKTEQHLVEEDKTANEPRNEDTITDSVESTVKTEPKVETKAEFHEKDKESTSYVESKTQICHFCSLSLGFLLHCQAEGCNTTFHPYCLRLVMHEYEQEGKNQISTCLELDINREASPMSLDLASGPGGIVRTFCIEHAPQPKYCICRRPFDNAIDASIMVGCDVCGDWLHSACIGAAAADCAVEADHYQCARCVGQRLHLAMLDKEWASIPHEEESIPRTRQLLAVMVLAAAVTSTSTRQLISSGLERPIPAFPETYDIGVVVPKHTTPLPFPDMLLVAAAWSLRVDLLLSADRVPASLISRSTRVQSLAVTELPVTSPPGATTGTQTTNRDFSESPASTLCKKKILLKKKTSAATTAVTTTPSTSFVKPVQISADLKKKKLGSGMNGAARTDLAKKPALSTGTSKPVALGIRHPAASTKPSLSQRTIGKKPLPSSSAAIAAKGMHVISTKQIGTSASKLVKPGLITAPKKKLPGTVGAKGTLMQESSGTAVSRRRPVPAPAEKKTVISSVTNRLPDKPIMVELPFQALCHLSSLHRLASSAACLPICVHHWLKDLSACITRCESWVGNMTKALETRNVEQMQLCLESHSPSVIQSYISVKSEPRPAARDKLPSINRIARISLSVSMKPSGVVVLGSLSNLTSDAITLRRRASVELFLEANRLVLDGPVTSVSLNNLQQIVVDIETKPELDGLKQHQLYLETQKLLKRVQECTVQSKNLKATMKAQLSDLESLIEEVRTALPGDANIDLFTLPELLSRGRSLEAQIDWGSLRSMRDVLSQIQHMPITSPTFAKLQKAVARVDAWRRDFQRVVSLMKSNTDGGDGGQSGHRRNVVVSGQSGFLKDLFSGQGGQQGLHDANGDEADNRNYTQSQSVDEARALLEKGLELSIQCEEVSQLQGWVSECDDWVTSVQESLVNSIAEVPISSWNIESLRHLQRRQRLLPFAVKLELNSRLAERIDELLKIESDLLSNILARQNYKTTGGHKLLHESDIQQYLATIDCILRGAELSPDPTRAIRLRELKSGLDIRIQRFTEWMNLIGFVLTTTDQLLSAMDKSDCVTNAILPEQLQYTVRYPLAPYVGSVVSRPLFNTLKLVQGHWFGFSEDEIQRLSDSVSSSIHITDPSSQSSPTAQSPVHVTDDYDDDLFEMDDSLLSITSGVDVIKDISVHFNQIMENGVSSRVRVKATKLQIQHAVIVIIHFLVLCHPDTIRLNPLFPFLQHLLAPLLLSLNLNGSALFGSLLPGPSELLRRLVRAGGIVSPTSEVSEVPTLLSDQWNHLESGWRFFQVDPENHFISRCIARLVGIWVLTAGENYTLAVTQDGGETLVDLVSKSCDNLGIQFNPEAIIGSSEEELETVSSISGGNELATLYPLIFSSGARHQLQILSVLQGFKQICSSHQMSAIIDEDQGLFGHHSLESKLRKVLQHSTWHLRASRVAKVLSSIGMSSIEQSNLPALRDVCELLDEYDHLGKERLKQEILTDNSVCTLRNHLKSYVDEANLWLQKVHEKLLQPSESLVFVPQLLYCWDQVISSISLLRPSYVLLAVLLSEGQSCRLPNIPILPIGTPTSVAAIFTNCIDWDRSTWEKVLTALRSDWYSRQHQPNNPSNWKDLKIVSSDQLPSILLGAQQTALLSVCGELALQSVPTHATDHTYPTVIKSLPEHQHFQAFQTAISSSFSLLQPHSRMSDVIHLDQSNEPPVVTQIRCVIDASLLASSTSSVRFPVFFCSKGLQDLSKALSSGDRLLSTASCSAELGWTKALSACLLQGWASCGVFQQNQYDNIDYEEKLLDYPGFRDGERAQRYHAAAVSVGSRLIELIKGRSNDLKQLFFSRPALCRTTDQASRLLRAQLELCEWTEAAVVTLAQLEPVDDDHSFGDMNMSLSQKMREKPHIERLVFLSIILDHLKEEITEILELSTPPPSIGFSTISEYCTNVSSNWADVLPAFCGDAKIANLGGFLAFEIQQQLSNVRSMIRAPILQTGLTTPDIIKQSILLRQILYGHFHQPTTSLKTKTTAGVLLPSGALSPSATEMKSNYEIESEQSFQSLLNEYHNAVASIDVAVNIHKVTEASVLALMKLLFTLFLRELTKPLASASCRDRTTLLNQIMGMLPPRLFEYLKTLSIEGQSPWIPKIQDIALLHISSSLGIIAIRVVMEPTTLPPAPDVIFAESGGTDVGFTLPADTDLSLSMGDGTGGAAGGISTSEVFLLHPRCLFSLATAVDLESVSCEPWMSIVDAQEFEEIARNISFLDTSVEIERLQEFSLQALVKFVLSKVTTSSFKDNHASNQPLSSPVISNTLYAPLKIIHWRLSTMPYLFPRVVPHDLLDSFLRDYQLLVPEEEQIVLDTAVPLPNDTTLSQILHHHHLLHLIGSPTSVTTLLPMLANSPLVIEQATHLLTRKPLLAPEEQRELAGRFSRTAAVMFEFARMNSAISVTTCVSMEGEKSRGSIPTPLSIGSLTVTAQRILREQLVMHPAVESLYLYLEELGVWEQTTKHTLERLQARQEVQHHLLERLRHVGQQLQCRPPELALNSWGMKSLDGEVIQLVWDSYGMSRALDCDPTVPSTSLLGFPTSIAQYEALKLLYDRGESLSCSVRDAHLEALQRQLIDVIRALEHLKTQSKVHIKSAIQMMSIKDTATNTTLNTSLYSTAEVTRDQLELFLRQSLFAELPTHPQTKDLFRRIVEVEYFATVAFSESNILSTILNPSYPIPDVQIQLPAPMNTKPFYEQQDELNKEEIKGENGDVEMPSTTPSLNSFPVESLPPITSTIAWNDLVASVYERCQAEWCPIASPHKSQILQYCWIAAVRLLFVTGDPFGSPSLSQRRYRTPSYKTIQTLYSIGRPLFETATLQQTVPPELKLLKVLLAAAKSFLTEAKGSVDQWVRLRLVLPCFPLYLKEEMRLLKTRLQQRLNIFIEIVTKEHEIQEVQLFKEGQLRQRYVPSTRLPDNENDLTSDDVHGKKTSSDGATETDDSEHNKRVTTMFQSTIISAVLRRASSYRGTEQRPELKDSHQIRSITQIDLEQILFERIRDGVRFCILTLFSDGEQSANQREAVLFDATGRNIDEEYFRGFHQLLIKKLQQSVCVRKPAPSVAKQRTSATESSLEDLMTSSALAPSSQPKVSLTTLTATKRQSSLLHEEQASPLEHEATAFVSASPTDQNNDVDDQSMSLSTLTQSDLLPLESSGFLWHGQLSGTLMDGTPIGLNLWIVPLFSPVPHELRLTLRSSLSFSFDRGLSIAQFGEHLTECAETTTRLHVLLGADWSLSSSEVTNLVQLLRPKLVIVPTAVAKSQLLPAEIESLQNEALSEVVQVLSFNAICETDPSRPSARLWIVPPTPKLTESILPAGFPKSSQLVFGVLEVSYQRQLSVLAKNHPLGLIRNIAQSVTQSIIELQRQSRIGTDPSLLPPLEAIPLFSSLRIAVPSTDFEFVLTQPKSDVAVETFINLYQNQSKASSQSFGLPHGQTSPTQVITNVGVDVAPARIPKRARLLGDNDVSSSEWNNNNAESSEPIRSKVPPWQQQKVSSSSTVDHSHLPPWKAEVSSTSFNCTSSNTRGPTDPYSSSVVSRPQPAMVVTQATTLLGKSPPPWQRRPSHTISSTTTFQNTTLSPTVNAPPATTASNLPFAVPEVLKSLLQGAAAQLRHKQG